MFKKLTTEDFIKKAKEKHGDKYRYDKVDYKNTGTKVDILCIACDKYFPQTPNSHLGGIGCPICGIKRCTDSNRSTTEEFIEKAKEIHGDNYRYDKVDYKNAQTKVDIFCIACDKYFSQIPDSHLRGIGCPICGVKQSADNRRLTLEEFIEKAKEIHGDNYHYDKVDYKNAQTKVDILCIACDTYFPQKPNHHLGGIGCPICNHKTEKMVFKYLKEHQQSTKLRFAPAWCKNSDTGYHLPFDICIMDLKLIIEVDGPHHFSVVGYSRKPLDEIHTRDLDKEERAIENGYAMIRLVQEEVWDEKFDWKTALLEAIEDTKPGEICLISCEGKYDCWD